MNVVLLVGRLTRDPEMRTIAAGRTVTGFVIRTNDNAGDPDLPTPSEYTSIVVWDRLAEVCAQFLSKNQLVSIVGSLQTRSWDDDAGRRHWKTEVVAGQVQLLSGAHMADFAATVRTNLAAALGGS